MSATGTSGVDADAPLAIVSSDSHVSPRCEDLEPHCPRAYVDELRSYMSAEQAPERIFGESPGRVRRHQLNTQTAGHYDMDARLADMDADGIAAEVLFHGSFSRDPFPLAYHGLRTGAIRVATSPREAELALVGIQTYNRWMAAACQTAPDRLIGLGHLPTWDVAASVAEIRAATEAGLRTFNWPAMPAPELTQYDEPAWEPFWEACESAGAVLNTHAGAPMPGFRNDLPHSLALAQLEAGGWPSRRGAMRMIFGGVFERHPGLKLVLTEQPGRWWSSFNSDMDTSWMACPPALREVLPNPPSTYMAGNVLIGASFMASFEAAEAVELGYADNVMWGRDYPHREGTWAYTEDPDDFNRTKLALRDAFCDIDDVNTLKMVSGNAIALYGLDAAALGRIAHQIPSLSLTELHTPLSPDEREWAQERRNHAIDHTAAFRKIGMWA